MEKIPQTYFNESHHSIACTSRKLKSHLHIWFVENIKTFYVRWFVWLNNSFFLQYSLCLNELFQYLSMFFFCGFLLLLLVKAVHSILQTMGLALSSARPESVHTKPNIKINKIYTIYKYLWTVLFCSLH